MLNLSHHIDSILIVEDSAVQLAHAAALCRALGIAVHTARNGQLGLDLLTQLSPPPTLAIIDMVMPVMDGISMIEAMHEADIHLPLIIASTMNDGVLRSTAGLIASFGLPFVGTLPKPLQLPALEAMLRDFAAAPDPTRTQR
jgi:c-di-GMP phosphodiesterase